MARPKTFVPEEALDRGMHLLWRKGYEATSLQELLAAMRLSKSSFYDTFGSKSDFLVKALAHYIEKMLGGLIQDLGRGTAREAIARTFHMAIPTGGRAPIGCFVNNCAIELAHRDPRARAGVQRGLKRLEDGFYRAVVRGQKTGEISLDKRARTLARYLSSSLNGIQVLSRAGAARNALKEIAGVALSTLE